MSTLTDFATLKSLLDLGKASVSDYSGLQEIMDSVDAAISNFLERELTQAARTETVYIGQPSRMIPLRGLPVGSVSSVTSQLVGSDATTLTSTEYQITSYGLRLVAPVENAEIVVTYTGGPSTPPVDWLRAGQIQVRHEWSGKDHVAADSVTTDGGTVTRPGLELLPEVKRLLVADQHALLAVIG